MGGAERVVLADDHPVVRAGLRALLERQGRFRVVGEAEDGETAFGLITRLGPDIVVLDLLMPRLSGLGVVERARRSALPVCFLILTVVNDAAALSRAKELGVEGYLLKESPPDEILGAMEALSRGERYVGAALRAPVRDVCGEPVGVEPGTDEVLQALAVLTPTELLVVRHLAANKTSRQIAAVLNVSVRTVQNHRANVCEKLALRGANKLLEFALEHRSVLQGFRSTSSTS